MVMLAIGAAMSRRANAPTVLPGIDVLLTDSLGLISGKRLGLITNQTGVDARGVSTIDRLYGLPGVRLAALFAPEHGIRGAAAPGEAVGDSVDAETGLPIYSLYGANRAPTPSQLEGLDVLLVDLQDVGTRTFTYPSTMVLAMRAAAAAGKRIVVLDRPNPIGCEMEGPVLDTAYASFIGMLPVPLRHGMTLGELARFANVELRIGADRVVVPGKGWTRCTWFDATGLPWVRPSPNLPDLEAEAWYPGTVLFEATNLSVGRGTDAPFTQLGAPWLADTVRYGWLSGFGTPVTFTPRAPGDGKYGGVACSGVRLPAYYRGLTQPVDVALRILARFTGDSGSAFTLDSAGLARRLGVPLSRYGYRQAPGDDTSLVGPVGDDGIAAFRRRAAPYFLYR